MQDSVMIKIDKYHDMSNSDKDDYDDGDWCVLLWNRSRGAVLSKSICLAVRAVGVTVSDIIEQLSQWLLWTGHAWLFLNSQVLRVIIRPSARATSTRM